MTATNVPPPPINQPMTDLKGLVTNIWAIWFNAMRERSGGASDKVDAAHAAAVAAAPASREVLGVGGLHRGGGLSDNVALTFYVAVTSVAALPTAGINAGDFAYATDGRKPGEGSGAGTGVPVFRSNGNWVAVTSGATVTS